MGVIKETIGEENVGLDGVFNHGSL